MIVVDVTVLAYLLIEGPQTAEVVQLRKRVPIWAAPSLWRSELMNVLWKYLRDGGISMDLALEHMDIAQDMMADSTIDVRADEVLPLARSSGCTAYDCQYVELANRLSIPLVTHDRRLLRSFPSVASLPKDVFVP